MDWVSDGSRVLPVLQLDAKATRARLIAEHLGHPAEPRVVCFTSGNAGEQLRQLELQPVCVGPAEMLSTCHWWTPAEVRAAWPGHFDATSGHLPMHLMVQLGQELRHQLGELPPAAAVLTGSGETILALSWACPGTELVAVVNADEHTLHHAQMPLASSVAAACEVWDMATSWVTFVGYPLDTAAGLK